MEKALIIGIVFVVIIAGAFIFFNQDDGTLDITDTNQETNEEVVVDWKEAVLVDVNTGDSFKINDFSDKPILLESFAVWCPTCTVQQREIKKLHDEIGDAFISISFDTDPNEDEEKVREHTEKNGFNWIYVVSPIEVTRALIDEFGIGFVNAPSAPVVLICPDGTSRKLSSGVKSSDELKEEIESCNG